MHQANALLKHLHAAVEVEIKVDTGARDDLKLHNERMTLELEALATQYLAALPTLPGDDQPAASAAPSEALRGASPSSVGAGKSTPISDDIKGLAVPAGG